MGAGRWLDPDISRSKNAEIAGNGSDLHHPRRADFGDFEAKLDFGPVPRRPRLFRCGKKYFAHTRGSRDDACEVWGPADSWIQISRVGEMQKFRKFYPKFPAKNPGISTFGQFRGEWSFSGAGKSISRVLGAPGMMCVKFGGRPMAGSLTIEEARCRNGGKFLPQNPRFRPTLGVRIRPISRHFCIFHTLM